MYSEGYVGLLTFVSRDLNFWSFFVNFRPSFIKIQILFLQFFNPSTSLLNIIFVLPRVILICYLLFRLISIYSHFFVKSWPSYLKFNFWFYNFVRDFPKKNWNSWISPISVRAGENHKPKAKTLATFSDST